MPVKSLMTVLGLPAGDLRRPLRPLDAPALARGVAIVRALGLDARYAFKASAFGLPAAAEPGAIAPAATPAPACTLP